MLSKVRRRAREKGIPHTIGYSTREDKRFAVYLPDKPIHFGDKEPNTFIDHGDERRRRLFHSRFANNVGYNDPSSGLYYARHLLW